jgi:hypothetical protein
MRRSMKAAAIAAAALLAIVTAAPAMAHNGPGRGPAAAGVGSTTLDGPPAGRGRLANLGLTRVQVRAVEDALHAAMDQARLDKRTAALAPLVAAGTLSADQADALAAAGPGDVRSLVQDGTLTRDQVKAAHEAIAAAGKVDRDALAEGVLAALVVKGTITTEQAAAIRTRLNALPGPGPRGGQQGQHQAPPPPPSASGTQAGPADGVGGRPEADPQP